MQSVSSGIWTRIAMSISHDNNHYTKGTYKTTSIIGTQVNGFKHSIAMYN